MSQNSHVPTNPAPNRILRFVSSIPSFYTWVSLIFVSVVNIFLVTYLDQEMLPVCSCDVAKSHVAGATGTVGSVAETQAPNGNQLQGWGDVVRTLAFCVQAFVLGYTGFMIGRDTEKLVRIEEQTVASPIPEDGDSRPVFKVPDDELKKPLRDDLPSWVSAHGSRHQCIVVLQEAQICAVYVVDRDERQQRSQQAVHRQYLRHDLEAVHTSTTVSLYIVEEVLVAIGSSGLDLCNDTIIADPTSLEWRGFGSSMLSTSCIINNWFAGNMVDGIDRRGQWRWSYGGFAIIMPVCLGPAIAVLIYLDRAVVSRGIVNISSSNAARRAARKLAQQRGYDGPWGAVVARAVETSKTWAQAAGRNLDELDAFGLTLLGFGWSLPLLPFSLKTSFAYVAEPDVPGLGLLHQYSRLGALRGEAHRSMGTLIDGDMATNNTAALVIALVLVGFGGSMSVVGSGVAAQASVSPQDVALAISLLALW
ncbi:putative Siderophore iron transporter [Seiridium unicorne]|uniref:Siderophore iron transporter n=1 Tax=Seiridium unicorne TaxID=138068 RepID=A0ABR2UE86_9PEZI